MAGIDTGGRFVDMAPSLDGRPLVGAHDVMFDSASVSLTSALLTVQLDRPAMLVAYLMEDGAEVTVEGVSVGSRSVATGSGCCVPGSNGGSLVTPGAVDIRFREAMTLGGHEWKLTNTVRRLVITLPGQYILQLNDQQYLGMVHVEVVELGKISTRIPDAYVAGVL